MLERRSIADLANGSFKRPVEPRLSFHPARRPRTDYPGKKPGELFNQLFVRHCEFLQIQYRRAVSEILSGPPPPHRSLSKVSSESLRSSKRLCIGRIIYILQKRGSSDFKPRHDRGPER